MNMGEKDGITSPQKLLEFITAATDIEANLVQRITLRELSAFFNVPGTAVDFVMTALSQKKLNGRKVRVEEADQGGRPSGPAGGGGGFRGGRDRSSGGYSKEGGGCGADKGGRGGFRERNYSQKPDNQHAGKRRPSFRGNKKD